jgi:hypothetical protein
MFSWMLGILCGDPNPMQGEKTMTQDEKEKEQNMRSDDEHDEKEAPLIKPGFDYIWGSDQDDLGNSKEE